LTYVPSTGILTAKKFVGDLVGNVTGKISNAELADNASNLEVGEVVPSVATYYPTLVSATTGQTSIKVNNSQLQYLPVAGELISPKFRGELIGNASSTTTATNAANVSVADDLTNNLPTYPIFVNSPTGNQSVKTSSTNLSYVPSTGILTAKGFVGNLTGNISGQANSALTANTSTSAQTAAITIKSAVTDDVLSSTKFYPVFVESTTGNQSIKSSSSNLSYVPSTGILTAKGFAGNLVGDVIGQANTALIALNANNSTNSTNALNSAITDDNSSTTKFYPTFVGLASGNQAIRSSSSNLSYVPSTGELEAKKFVGDLVGNVTGKISNAELSENALNLEVGEVVPSVTTYYPTLVPATTGQTSIKVNNGKLQYLPLVGELISPKFRGELIGNASSTTTATNAANVAVADDLTNNLPTYPIFVNSPTGNQSVKSSSTNLSYVPSTGILKAKGFEGNLVGNVTGQVSNAQNAENASKINIATNDISAGTVYPVFVSGLSGSLQPNVSTNRLGFKPLTGELTATTFKGDLIGNSFTATTANNATNSLNSAVSDDNSTNSTFFPVFVGTASGNQGIKASSANLKFNPSNGILTSTGFAGPLVGNVTGEASSAISATTSSKVSISSDDVTAVTMYPTFVSGITGSLPIAVHTSKLGFKPAIGELTATVFKGDLAGIATNATSAVTADNALKSVIIDDASHSAVTYPLFVNDAAGNQPLRSNRTNLSYIPSSGTLTAKEFVGKLIGNVNGIATNAIDATNSANVIVTDDPASNSFKPLTFVDANTGNLPIKVSSKLRYNPFKDELVSTTFTGSLNGNALTATTISPSGLVLPVNGGTGFTSFAAGEILFAESATTLKKLPIGPFGAVLRVGQPGGTGTPLVPSWATTGPGTVTEVQYGGTGLNSLTQGGVLIGNGTNNITAVLGSVGQVLRSNGPGIAPSFQNAAGGDMILAGVQQVTGAKTFGTPGSGGFGGLKGVLQLAGVISGVTVLNGPDTGISGVVVLPQEGILATHDGTETLKNKELTSPKLTNPDIGDAFGTTLKLGGGTTLNTTNQTGTGKLVMESGALLIAPNIGAATGTSLNVGPGGTITAGSFVGNLTSGSATLTNLTVNNTISGSITGNAGTATKLAATKKINNVDFDGSTDITISAVADASTLTGSILANNVLSSSLTSVGTLGSLTVTAPILGSVTGNAGTSTKLETSRTIYGNAFDGSANLTQVISSSFGGTGNGFTKFVGATSFEKTYTLPDANATLARIDAAQTFSGPQTFTSTITGNINGNAATVTTNADLSGDVIGLGNTTTVKKINGVALADLSTGILKNTTLTGSPSIAIAGTDYLTPTGSAAGLTGFPTLNQNTTGNAATANKLATSKLIYGNTFDGSSNVSNIIASNFGGTGNGFTKFVGPSSSEKSYTLPDANAILARTDAAQTFTGVQTFTSTIVGSITGNAVTASKLLAPVNINGVSFDGSADINITAAANASALTGTSLANNVLSSSLTSVGTLGSLTVTAPITGSVTGNAGTATKLAVAKKINNVDFDGSTDITISAVANASTLTGATLANNVLSSSLTSVGTLGALTVTNPIVGSITGNASNVSGTVAIANGGTGATNQQTALNNLAGTQAAGRYLRSDGINTLLSTILAGDVPTLNQNTTGTAAGLNDAYIDWNAISGGKAILNKPTLNNGTVTSVAALTLGTSGTDLSSTVATNTTTPIITLNVPTASATNRGALSSADWTSFNAKQSALTFSTGLTNSSGTVTVNSTQNITNLSNLSSNGIVTTSGTNGALAVTPVNGTGNVVLTSGATLVNPNIGTANGSSLTLTGSLTSTATTGTAPFVVSSTTPVANLNIGGNAASATNLATARAINGIDFDGTASITISSAASTLTGNTLSSSILNSNLTSVGTLGSLSVTNPINGSLAGNAATATKLVASRTIYGNIFDGTANLDQVIAPGFGGTGNRFTEFVGPLGSIKKFTLPDNDAVLARTDAAQTFNGVQTFSSVIVGSINGNAATATTASGLNPSTTITSPNLITPLLGTATATSINKVLITGPVVSATLNLAEASTLATSGANSITLTSTGPTNVTLPTSGILVSAISASGIIDFTAVNANDSTTETIAVTGASDGDAVSLGVPSSLAGAGGIYTAWVSAPDTVTVKFSNTTAGLINPASATFKIKVLK
jgi:hypothetical protein